MGRTQKYTQLPIYRVRNLMKTTRDVTQVGNNATLLMAKATEMFITLLTEESFKNSPENELDYKSIAETVANGSALTFLREYIPQKITVRRYKEILKEAEGSQDEEDKEFYL